MKSIRVVGIGEVLMDVFENGAITLGGAPFNLAFHLHQLLRTLQLGGAIMVSTIGEDEWGEHVLRSMRNAGMNTEFIQIDGDHRTGSARVYESGGEAGFEIVPNVAWDYIHTTPALAELRSVNAVAFGTLAQRSPVSEETIQFFVSMVDGQRLYDVNLRRNTTNGVAGYSRKVIESSLRIATIVKMNDCELEEIAELLGFHSTAIPSTERSFELMQALREKYEVEAIAVTRAAKGALVLSNGSRFRLKDSTIPQDEVHPVGAGDSFAAGLLFGVVQGWETEYSLELAEMLSTWVVTLISATPLLSPEMVERIRNLVMRASTDPTVKSVTYAA